MDNFPIIKGGILIMRDQKMIPKNIERGQMYG